MNRSHHFLRLTASTALLLVASLPTYAEGTGQYSDEVNWSINRTTERASGMNAGGMVGDMAMPGYNPNALRPAGDGFGRHQATQDVEMQGNSLTGVREITGVSRIVGSGVLVIENLDYPIDGYDAANKAYVDEEIARAAEDLEDSVNDVQAGLDNLTGGDGIDRNGDSFEVNDTVVRTFGDQNIGGVKNFQTRINVSSTSNRPFDSRSSAVDGIGVYGRSTSDGSGFGTLGIADGTGGMGAVGIALEAKGRGGNFEATGQDGTGLFALSTGSGGRAAQFRSKNDADSTVNIIGWDDGDTLLSFGVDQTISGAFSPIGAVLADGSAIRITGVATPISGTDAVNKDYVDGTVAAMEPSIPNLTDVLTEGNDGGGHVIRNIDLPTLDADAANKAYVDALIEQLRKEIITDTVEPPSGASFLFDNIDPAILRQTIYSRPETIINTPAPVTVSISGAGTPQVSVNGGPWSTSVTIENGDELQARLTTGSSYSEEFRTTFSIDGEEVSGWRVTTGSSCLINLVGMQCTDGTAYAGNLISGERWYLDTFHRDNNDLYAFQDEPFDLDPDRSTLSGYANTHNAGPGFAAAAACKARGEGWFLPGADEWLSVYKTNGADEIWENGGINRFEDRVSGVYDLIQQATFKGGQLGYSDADAREDFEQHYWTSTESSTSDNNGTGRALFVWHHTDGDVNVKSARRLVLSNPQENKDYLGRVRCARVDSGVTPSLTVATRSDNDMDGENTAQASVRIND